MAKKKSKAVDERQSIIDILTFTGDAFPYNEKYSFEQSTVKDAISNPAYNIALLPFTLTTDYFIEKDATIRSTLDGFFRVDKTTGKYLFEQDGIPLLSYLIIGIKYFFKTENVNIGRGDVIIVDDSFTITRNNFEDIADIITQMNGRERVKKLVPPENLNDAQREIWVKTMKGRKRKAEKDSMTMMDIINIVIHFGESYNYKAVMDLTILQLYNTFSVLMKKDRFNRFYSIYSSGQFNIKDMEDHWVTTISKKYISKS